MVLGEGGALGTLGLVTALWGSQHAVTKYALASCGDDGAAAAALLTSTRFGVAAALLVPFLPRDGVTWRDGLELGLWGFLGFACQTVGLETTTATRSAFLLYLNATPGVPLPGPPAGPGTRRLLIPGVAATRSSRASGRESVRVCV